jgi:hypothetical protein
MSVQRPMPPPVSPSDPRTMPTGIVLRVVTPAPAPQPSRPARRPLGLPATRRDARVIDASTPSVNSPEVAHPGTARDGRQLTPPEAGFTLFARFRRTAVRSSPGNTGRSAHMSDAKPTDHAPEAAGRHRGPASVDEADRSEKSQAPHGRHRRPQDD